MIYINRHVKSIAIYIVSGYSYETFQY